MNPVIGGLIMVIVTIILASMFSVMFPHLYDLELTKDTAQNVQQLDASTGDTEEVVYTDEQGKVYSITPDGRITSYRSGQAEGIGPKKADLDGDGRDEVPYVDGSNHLKLVDDEGQTQVLVSDARKTRLGVGRWGSATKPRELGVYYVNNSNGDVYRVAAGEPPESVLSGGFKSVAGIADYNGDGDTDIVFVGNSGALAYYDDGSTHSPGFGQVGHSASYGVGEPQNGRVPVVNGDPKVSLLGPNGSAQTLEASSNTKKAPVTAIDWTGGPSLEVVYVGRSGHLYYATQNGNKSRVKTLYGDPVKADADQGVA